MCQEEMDWRRSFPNKAWLSQMAAAPPGVSWIVQEEWETGAALRHPCSDQTQTLGGNLFVYFTLHWMQFRNRSFLLSFRFLFGVFCSLFLGFLKSMHFFKRQVKRKTLKLTKTLSRQRYFWNKFLWSFETAFLLLPCWVTAGCSICDS